MHPTLASIEAAHHRIQPAIPHTPCPYSLSLSRLCHAEVFCKLEHLQMTGSFKERGARNKLLQLTEAQRRLGVIAASAGNHALALAYHGKLLGIPVTVVMPRWAPLVKVSNCEEFGAKILLHGDSYDDSRQKAEQLAAENHLELVSGFDDPDIIAGQGTLGLEILQDVPSVDAIFVPVGGGGLIAGVGAAVKSLQPGVRIIGVEAANAPTLHESLRLGRVTRVQTKPTLADGLAVAQIGKLCFEWIRQVVDELILVDESEIAQSILRLAELEKMVVEGAGAVPLAAAVRKRDEFANKKIVLCLTGGNIDVTTLSKIIERGLAAEGRLCRIVAFISDRPGSLAKLTAILADTGASVKEIFHDRHFGPPDVAMVAITCILETRGFDHIEKVKAALVKSGTDFRLTGE